MSVFMKPLSGPKSSSSRCYRARRPRLKVFCGASFGKVMMPAKFNLFFFFIHEQQEKKVQNEITLHRINRVVARRGVGTLVWDEVELV